MILVAGATGTVGSEVVRRFLPQVYSCVRSRAILGKWIRFGSRTLTSSKETSRMSIRSAGRAPAWTGHSS